MRELPGLERVLEATDLTFKALGAVVGEAVGLALVGDPGVLLFTGDPSRLREGLEGPDERRRAGVTQPLLPDVAKASCSSEFARATEYSLARA